MDTSHSFARCKERHNSYRRFLRDIVLRHEDADIIVGHFTQSDFWLFDVYFLTCVVDSEGHVTKWFIGLTFSQPSGIDVELTYDIRYFCDVGKCHCYRLILNVSGCVLNVVTTKFSGTLILHQCIYHSFVVMRPRRHCIDLLLKCTFV
jgi:hypothetical protein